MEVTAHVMSLWQLTSPHMEREGLSAGPEQMQFRANSLIFVGRMASAITTPPPSSQETHSQMLLRTFFASPEELMLQGNWWKRGIFGAAFGVVKSAMARGIQRLKKDITECETEDMMHCTWFLERKQ